MVFFDRPHHLLISPEQRWKRMGIFVSIRVRESVCMCKSRYPQKRTGSAYFAQHEWYVSLPAAFWLSLWKHTSNWGSEIALGGKVTGFALCCNAGQQCCGTCAISSKWQNRHYSFEELSTGLWIIVQTKYWYWRVKSVYLGYKVELQVCFDTGVGQFGSPEVISTGWASKILWQWCSRPFFWWLICLWDLSVSSRCKLLPV